MRTARKWTRDVFIVDPGREVPPGAEAIHGISTQRARDEGCPLDEAAAVLHAALGKAQADNEPVVVMNASFDITIAATLFRSFALAPIEWRAVVDPLVIDRKVDNFRPGRRRLDALCEIYHWASRGPRAGLRRPRRAGNLRPEPFVSRSRGWPPLREGPHVPDRR